MDIRQELYIYRQLTKTYNDLFADLTSQISKTQCNTCKHQSACWNSALSYMSFSDDGGSDCDNYTPKKIENGPWISGTQSYR
jgi:hypothetical protein